MKKLIIDAKICLTEGAIEEVQSFIKNKCNHSHPLHKAIGLDPISLLLLGKINKEECISIFTQDTRRYAKKTINMV